VNAAPTTTAMAKSMTLPRIMKSRNPLIMCTPIPWVVIDREQFNANSDLIDPNVWQNHYA
jgi:hypothetical protein